VKIKTTYAEKLRAGYATQNTNTGDIEYF